MDLSSKKIAIMQPYFFPSISYFRLINAVDLFVFLDDVCFIKKGWINRNKILLNGKPHTININCKSLSQNKKINEIKIDYDKVEISRKLKTVFQAYKNAPFFKDVYPFIENTMFFKTDFLSNYSANTIIQTIKYLGLKKEFRYSSIDFENTYSLKGEKRIIDICKKIKTDIYINSEGGKNLYSAENFNKEKIELNFLKSNYPLYNQFENQFISMLSIIDILMFNSKENILDFLNEYNLN